MRAEKQTHTRLLRCGSQSKARAFSAAAEGKLGNYLLFLFLAQTQITPPSNTHTHTHRLHCSNRSFAHPNLCKAFRKRHVGRPTLLQLQHNQHPKQRHAPAGDGVAAKQPLFPHPGVGPQVQTSSSFRRTAAASYLSTSRPRCLHPNPAGPP